MKSIIACGIFIWICSSIVYARHRAVLGVVMNQNLRHDLFEMAEKADVLIYRIDRFSFFDAKTKKMEKVRFWTGTEWQRQSEQPLPDAVYDFSYFRSNRVGRIPIRRLMFRLQSLGIPFFVPMKTILSLRNKMLFAKIMADANLSHPTTVSDSDENLRDLLAQFSSVYVKPVWGNHGFGMMVISKTAQGYDLQYDCQIDDGEMSGATRVIEPIDDFDHLVASLQAAKRHMGTQDKDYFFQQGMDFYRYQGKQTYFRVFTQRGKDGKLVIGPEIAKVGGSLTLGGFATDLATITQAMGLDSSQAQGDINRLALETHRALEKEHGEKIVELGMDIGILIDGQVYVLEANDKPGYFRRSEDMSAFEIAFNERRNRLNLQYTSYLFKTRKPKGSGM